VWYDSNRDPMLEKIKTALKLDACNGESEELIFPVPVSGIYLIMCFDNHRVYVGSSINVQRRLREHYYKLIMGTHWNVYMQRSWNKYGKDSFFWDVLEIVDNKDDLFKTEKRWMKLYQTKEYGFNFREAKARW
jgi:group I intron endonuclease